MYPDKHFLEEYILHLGYEDKDFEINAVNGWCNLKNFTPKLRQEEDASLGRQGFGYPQFNSYKLHRTLETRT